MAFSAALRLRAGREEMCDEFLHLALVDRVRRRRHAGSGTVAAKRGGKNIISLGRRSSRSNQEDMEAEAQRRGCHI